MKDINSLTILIIIIIIYRETELVHEGLGGGLDFFKELLDILLTTTVVALQHQAHVKVKKAALDDSNHMSDSCDGSLGQLLHRGPALFSGFKRLLQLFDLLLQSRLLPLQDVGKLALVYKTGNNKKIKPEQ